MSPLFWIILLIVLGMLLFFAELVILPGLTIAAVGAFICLVGASGWAFAELGVCGGFVTLSIITALVVLMLIFFMRSKTWKKVALHTEIRETISAPIEDLCRIGDLGQALTRLAPMGKVIVGGKVFEAKTMGEYLDEGNQIEVIGFDNQNVIVKLK